MAGGAARRGSASRRSSLPRPICRRERRAPPERSFGPWNAAAATVGSPRRAAGTTRGRRDPGASSPPLATRWPPAANCSVPTAGGRSWRYSASGLRFWRGRSSYARTPAVFQGVRTQTRVLEVKLQGLGFSGEKQSKRKQSAELATEK